ncbi:hypothetical protein BO71DRAFT_338024 [Aspergillus ellipticus CBS 707.79]|uniref:Uncharacterized protein n=1 Tax=Aspergillus ellipticus CBS 707.79 TaxID=1448320 RepID=A0A319CUJ4_9EURO|nr:hypothetical protein BO71DRAFT_338024 [Aspergillus ellipticus CBS 707.79]
MKPQKCSRQLGSINPSNLNEDEVLFCYGVLATQALLLPRFYFSNSKGSRWGLKLTMYGHTIIRSNVYPSQKAAKVDVCRAAMKKLQADYPEWILPEEDDCLVTSGWNWTGLLRDYCTHNGLPAPEYIRILHKQGHCHAVKVQCDMYTGPIDYYPSEFDSQNASAYRALQALWIHGTGCSWNSSGPIPLKNTDEQTLANVPRPPESLFPDIEHSSLLCRKRQAESEHVPLNSPKPNKKQKQMKKGPGNSNLLKLTNCRLPTIDVPAQEEEKRWKVTPKELLFQIGTLLASTDRLKKVCNLLGLEDPEIRVQRTDGRLIEAYGEYTGGVYFNEDPFLMRASPIGRISNMQGTEVAVKDACAERAVDYLIRMVEEDLDIEQTAAKERGLVGQWGDAVRELLKENGAQHV